MRNLRIANLYISICWISVSQCASVVAYYRPGMRLEPWFVVTCSREFLLVGLFCIRESDTNRYHDDFMCIDIREEGQWTVVPHITRCASLIQFSTELSCILVLHKIYTIFSVYHERSFQILNIVLCLHTLMRSFKWILYACIHFQIYAYVGKGSRRSHVSLLMLLVIHTIQNPGSNVYTSWIDIGKDKTLFEIARHLMATFFFGIIL